MVSKLEPIAYSCDLHADLLRLWNREYPTTVLAYAQLADLEQYLKGLKDTPDISFTETQAGCSHGPLCSRVRNGAGLLFLLIGHCNVVVGEASFCGK